MDRTSYELLMSGEALENARKVAELRGWTVEQLIAHTINVAMPDPRSHAGTAGSWGEPVVSTEAEVKPYTLNEGNGGFHVFTVVADGYGWLVAEDANGKELAREKADGVGDDPEHFHRLTVKALAKLDERYV